MPALSVTQLVEAINATLEVLQDVEVEGEVDEFKIVHSKWVTFQLKDEHSSIGCFLTVWQYRTQVEDGMLVHVKGKPTLRNKGFFSLVISSMQPSGEGALKRAFELLRQKLESEDLFAPERKRSLPRFPEHIALITSREAAAYSDFLKILVGRQGGLTISFIHTQVQGEDAPRQLCAALDQANTDLKNVDAIVMVRGGGSLEDLQAFNDETVVRAVAASRTPIVVGVGHERDITLAELAADVRASTPSNAAELLVRSRQEVSLAVDHLRENLHQHLFDQLRASAANITHALTVLRARIALPKQRVARQLESLSALRQRIRQTIRTVKIDINRRHQGFRQQFQERLVHQKVRTEQLTRVLMSLSPERTLHRGYSITRNKRGNIVTAAQSLQIGDELVTQFAKGTTRSRVTGQDSQPKLNI